MRRLLEDVCKLLEMRGLKPYDSRLVAKALEQWKEAAIPDGVWLMPLLYRYRTAHSLPLGWERVHQLDTASLDSLAWQFSTQVSEYALIEQLDGFQLDTISLDLLAWHLYTQVSEYALIGQLEGFQLDPLTKSLWAPFS